MEQTISRIESSSSTTRMLSVTTSSPYARTDFHTKVTSSPLKVGQNLNSSCYLRDVYPKTGDSLQSGRKQIRTHPFWLLRTNFGVKARRRCLAANPFCP